LAVAVGDGLLKKRSTVGMRNKSGNKKEEEGGGTADE
jgi:hypothetical protein